MTLQDRLLKNIYGIASEKKIKIGTLEAEIGVSVGYFSRVRKGTNHINIELMEQIAGVLDVEPTELLSIRRPKCYYCGNDVGSSYQSYIGQPLCSAECLTAILRARGLVKEMKED